MSTKVTILIFIFILNLGANERVVSLSPSITEIIYALGAGEKLVATSSYSLFPKEAKKLPVIGNHTDPNIEKILSYLPTLVVGETFNQAKLKQLKQLHIKTLMLRLQTIKSIKKSITILAKQLHKGTQATKLITKITDAIKEAPKSKKPHSVMIVYGLSEDLRSAIYIAGHNIFFDDIIRLSGNTNAYTEISLEQPVLNYENIIALNPDQIIILRSHATQANVNVTKALRAWYSIPTNAAKNGRISVIDDDYLHIPSDRIALSIKRLTREMND